MKFVFDNIYVAESFEGIKPLHYDNGTEKYVEGRKYDWDECVTKCLWQYVGDNGAFFMPTGIKYCRIRKGKLVEFIVRAIHYQYEEGRYQHIGYKTILEIVYPNGEVEYLRNSFADSFPYFKSVEHYAECACGESRPYFPSHVNNLFDSFVGFEQYRMPNKMPHKGFAWRYKMDNKEGLVRKPCGFYEIVVIGNNAYVILDAGNRESTEKSEGRVEGKWYISKEKCIKDNLITEFEMFGDDESKLAKVKVDVIPIPKVPKIIQIKLEE